MTVESLKTNNWGDGIYKIKDEKNSYVLRFMNSIKSKSALRDEANISIYTSNLGVSPKIFVVSLKDRIIIMEEMKDGPLMESKLSTNQVRNLAEKLRILHKLPPIAHIPTKTPKENLKGILNMFKIALPENFKTVLIELENDFIELENKESYALSHTDLNPGNICKYNEEIKIIDWEDAHITNPYMDIATIILFYKLDKEQLNIFIKTYFKENTTAVNYKKLRSAFKIMNFIYATRLLGISQVLPDTKDQNNELLLKQTKELFKDKNWKIIFPTIQNRNRAYIMALLYLEQSTKEFRLPIVQYGGSK